MGDPQFSSQEHWKAQGRADVHPGGFPDELCQSDLFAEGAQHFALPAVPVGELQPPPMMDAEISKHNTPYGLCGMRL